MGGGVQVQDGVHAQRRMLTPEGKDLVEVRRVLDKEARIAQYPADGVVAVRDHDAGHRLHRLAELVQRGVQRVRIGLPGRLEQCGEDLRRVHPASPRLRPLPFPDSTAGLHFPAPGGSPDRPQTAPGPVRHPGTELAE